MMQREKAPVIQPLHFRKSLVNLLPSHLRSFLLSDKQLQTLFHCTLENLNQKVTVQNKQNTFLK